MKDLSSKIYEMCGRPEEYLIDHSSEIIENKDNLFCKNLL